MCNVRWFLVPLECKLTCFTFLSETVVSVIISYEKLPRAKLSWGSSTLFTAKTLKKTSITLRTWGKAVMDKSEKIFRQPPPSNHSKRGQLAPENVSDGVTDNKSIAFSLNVRQENWSFDMFVICCLFYLFWLFVFLPMSVGLCDRTNDRNLLDELMFCQVPRRPKG